MIGNSIEILKQAARELVSLVVETTATPNKTRYSNQELKESQQLIQHKTAKPTLGHTKRLEGAGPEGGQPDEG